MPAAPVSPSHGLFPHTSLMSKCRFSSSAISPTVSFQLQGMPTKCEDFGTAGPLLLPCLSLWGFGHNYEGRPVYHIQKTWPQPKHQASRGTPTDQGRKVRPFCFKNFCNPPRVRKMVGEKEWYPETKGQP